MPEWMSRRPVPVNTLILARALAMLLILANHSGFAPGRLPGGTNVLFLVSGVTMAMFGFGGSTRETIGCWGRFAWRIAWPSVLLIVGWGLLGHDFRWQEAALISNLQTWRTVAPFPVWYIQICVQTVLLFGLLFWVGDLTPKINRDPVRMTFAILLHSILIYLVLLAWERWKVHGIGGLPHKYAWNFVLGWFLWAAIHRWGRSPVSGLALSLVLIGAGAISLLHTTAPHGGSRWIWLTVLGLLLIWRESLTLPRWLAHPVSLISRATFPIFLLHFIAILGMDRLFASLGVEPGALRPWACMAVGLLVPILLWAWWTAMRRTFARNFGKRLSMKPGSAGKIAERRLPDLVRPLASAMVQRG